MNLEQVHKPSDLKNKSAAQSPIKNLCACPFRRQAAKTFELTAASCEVFA